MLAGPQPPRLDAWAENLIEVVAWHQRNAFEWFRFDCGTLFRDAVCAVTGEDISSGGAWPSERDALRFLAQHRVKSMAEFAAARFPEIAPSVARRGDLVLPERVHQLMCPAIVMGSEAVSRDEHGWIAFSRTLAVRAFQVGA